MDFLVVVYAIIIASFIWLGITLKKVGVAIYIGLMVSIMIIDKLWWNIVASILWLILLIIATRSFFSRRNSSGTVASSNSNSTNYLENEIIKDKNFIADYKERQSRYRFGSEKYLECQRRIDVVERAMNERIRKLNEN